MKISHAFSNLQYVNFGGGFGIDYEKSGSSIDFRALKDSLDSLVNPFMNRGKPPPRFIIEPGRYYVATAGKLLSTVNSIKKTGDRTYLGINTGYNHFARCFLYEAYHEITNLSKKDSIGVSQLYDVAGYLCQSGDIFARDRRLPLSLPGDVICIHDVGAYGFAMSSNFNSRLKLAEVLFENGECRLIRERESLQDILHKQIF